MIRETAVQFGDTNNIEGVLSHPNRADENSPALILLSAGLLHKVGPNRLYPILARRMAKKGLYTLRFDMQGIGDSLPASGPGSLVEQTRDSILAAMRLITRQTGKDKFILGGLCSGAEDSFRMGSEDERVVGLILLDAHAYSTLKHKLNHLWYRLRRKTLRIFGYYLHHDPTTSKTNDEAVQRFGFIELPDRDWVVSSLRKMIARSVKLLYVYSGSWQYFNYRNQFYEMFSDVDFKDASTVHYFHNQDHTMTLRSDQDRLINAVVNWYDASID